MRLKLCYANSSVKAHHLIIGNPDNKFNHWRKLMPNIAIITDTDSSIPAALADKYNIIQVPINVQFGDETFETGIDIDDESLFARVDKEGKLPTTAAPSPGKFAEAYHDAFDAGADQVICICVSSEISATYSAALNAVDMVPDKDITVLDSLSLSMGQGFMVLAAAEAVEAGASKEDVIKQSMEVKDRTSFYGALSTLKYLAMSGRVGHLAAGMANLFNVKPILTIRDGKLDMLERVRTQRKSWSRMTELVIESVGNRPVERLSIVHVAAFEKACEYEAQLKAHLDYPENIIYAELTPGLSVHSGAGLVGVGIVVGK
jgi:DegV family protein with EDD domain